MEKKNWKLLKQEIAVNFSDGPLFKFLKQIGILLEELEN